VSSPRLVLLDGHSLAYRAFYALPVENFSTATGQPTNAVYGFTSMLINALRDEQPTHLAQKFARGVFVMAVEMDPPRGLAPHKIIAGASMLAEAGADVINVADSPMARMRMSPWAVCELIQRDVGIETTLHFPTRGRNLLRVQGDLLAAHALGIRNVFVVMGDPTAIGDYPDAMDDYDLVPSGLMKLIKQQFNQGVDHAGSDIGQPTSFFVGAALNLLPPDPEREIKVLRRKIANGADFALTQPVYQPEEARVFLERYRQLHGRLEMPVLVGILPLFSARQFRNQPRDGKFHDKRCTFFLARLGPLAGPPQEAGHTPRWVAPDSVIGRMVEPCHDWAIATLLAR